MVLAFDELYPAAFVVALRLGSVCLCHRSAQVVVFSPFFETANGTRTKRFPIYGRVDLPLSALDKFLVKFENDLEDRHSVIAYTITAFD